MGRERAPLKRSIKGECIVNLEEIWRNPDVQRQALRELKKFKIKK